MKYRSRIQLLILGSTAVIYIGAMSFFLMQYISKAEKEAFQYIDVSTKQCAIDVEAAVNMDVGMVRSLAHGFGGMIESGALDQSAAFQKTLDKVMASAPYYRQLWTNYTINNHSDSSRLNYLSSPYEAGQVVKGIKQQCDFITIDALNETRAELMQKPYWVYGDDLESDSAFASSFCVPIVVNDQAVGLVGLEQALNRYQSLSHQAKPFETSKAYLITNGGFTISAGTSTGSNIYDSDFFTQHNVEYYIRRGESYSFEAFSKRSKTYLYYSVAPIKIGDTNTPWSIIVKTSKKDVLKDVERLKWTMVIIGVIGLLLMFFIVRSITNGIVSHIEEFTVFSNEINQGNLFAKMDVNRDDEIGDLAKALKGMVESIHKMASGLHQNGTNVGETATYLNDSSQSLSALSSRQAAAVEEVASAMEQMAANVSANTDNARKTEDIALLAKEELLKTVHVVKQSHQDIEQIVEEINIISDIAMQTNILALNASVEASRAGDAGRGFSVVAAEVRKLAERSQEASDSITNSATSVMESSVEIKERVEKLVPNIEQTEEYVREITTAGVEQHNGAMLINNSIQEINVSTQENAAAASDYSEAAHKLTQQAEELREAIKKFKL